MIIFQMLQKIQETKIPHSSKHFSEFLKNSNDKRFLFHPQMKSKIFYAYLH